MDQNVIKLVKVTQANLARTWQGLDTEKVGRPGIYALMAPGGKKYTKLQESLKIEDERFRYV